MNYNNNNNNRNATTIDDNNNTIGYNIDAVNQENIEGCDCANISQIISIQIHKDTNNNDDDGGGKDEEKS